jgi:hypothetical protein
MLSAADDPALYESWATVSFSVAKGSFFGEVLSETRSMVEDWTEIPEMSRGGRWEHWLTHDYGVAAPSVTYLLCRSPGAEGPDGKWYPWFESRRAHPSCHAARAWLATGNLRTLVPVAA